jgi:polyhydroxyalkanoate synthase
MVRRTIIYVCLPEPTEGSAMTQPAPPHADAPGGDPLRSALDAFRQSLDPFGIATGLMEVQQTWLQHPYELAHQLTRLGSDLWSLQFYTCENLYGVKCGDVFPAVEYDERFQEDVWKDNAVLDLIKQYYLLYTRWLEDTVFDTPGVDEKTRRKAAYWVRQGLNALAPTNYFWTNPQAVQQFYRSAGRNLLDGMQNWVRDSKDMTISMVDGEAFEVGRNVATTPGQVVYRNELLELIQYAPATEQVRAMPIAIVAPWINKYYILDINAKKSLVKYLTEQGFTVFITSWKNPTREMADTTFDDYMVKGVLPALHAARDIAGSEQVHAVGYCIGGTLLAILMAWLARGDGEPSPIAHWTLFTTLTDFEQPGDIDVFIDEQSVAHLERMMDARGYLDGGEMAWSFRMLRSNSLIWHYWVHNYLYGEEPPQWDVLYWNTDATRLPRTMHAWYLRELYLNDRLKVPDALTLAGRPIDLSRVTAPVYAVGTEQDHIAPWKETFKVARHLGGSVRYVLATSGHIIGIVNPPVTPPKRRYWAGDATGHSDPEAWRAGIEKVPGSWWEDWVQWLHERTGEQVPPPPLGNDRHPAIEPAPGRYVRER